MKKIGLSKHKLIFYLGYIKSRYTEFKDKMIVELDVFVKEYVRNKIESK